jgi:hypothetical protein
MHYTNNPVCTAHISINRNRVKNYGSEVFLKDGQNFEIELYNPKQNSVLAKISINGQAISSSGFILRPGQRVFIERFIDEAKKLVFSTYEVSDTSQNMKAIANNGTVEVSFYDEYVPFYNSMYWYNSTGQPYQGLNFTTTGNVGIGCSNPTSTLTIGGTTTNNAFYSSTNMNVAGSFSTNTIETGRVEAGPSSSQSFSTAYGNFNSWASSTQTIKILPTSHRPVENSEVRNYCTNCGSRAKKSTWKFCPSCGSKL